MNLATILTCDLNCCQNNTKELIYVLILSFSDWRMYIIIGNNTGDNKIFFVHAWVSCERCGDSDYATSFSDVLGPISMAS